MVICPSCGSSRIRNDYKPAPFFIRVIGIRALLCDNCNFPFRAFSPLPPKTRRGRIAMQKADVFNPAPEVDLTKLASDVVNEKPELKLVPSVTAKQSNPVQKVQLDVVVSAIQSKSRIASDLAVPIRNDLRTEITKLHTQPERKKIELKTDISAGDESPESLSQSKRNSSTQICPECDSQNIKRRHRNLMERALLSVTDHKPYVCRSCGASFYARSESQTQHSHVGSNEAA